MKRYIFIIFILVLFVVQGCSNKFQTPKYSLYPMQYNNRTDSIAGIEAREALDSLSFYLKGYTEIARNAKNNYYSPVNDLFINNEEVILHNTYGGDWIGKISHVNFTKRRKGKYDYVLSFYMQGKEKFSQNHVSVKVRLFLQKNSDKVYGIITRSHRFTINMYGRIEPLVGPPERYRQSFFRQTLNPGKTLIIDGDTIKIR